MVDGSAPVQRCYTSIRIEIIVNSFSMSNWYFFLVSSAKFTRIFSIKNVIFYFFISIFLTIYYTKLFWQLYYIIFYIFHLKHSQDFSIKERYLDISYHFYIYDNTLYYIIFYIFHLPLNFHLPVLIRSNVRTFFEKKFYDPRVLNETPTLNFLDPRLILPTTFPFDTRQCSNTFQLITRLLFQCAK